MLKAASALVGAVLLSLVPFGPVNAETNNEESNYGWWDVRTMQRSLEEKKLQEAQSKGEIWCYTLKDAVSCKASTDKGTIALEVPLSRECASEVPPFWDLQRWLEFNDSECLKAPKMAVLAAAERLNS
ncbi:hypothetical protein ACTXL8_17680 [Glutamicibacter arilaitensis]|uniref:hypothetical protein n=1 Tax=Glutamicibacter arilaitensis TaxID=256701 RepID=UPI003FD31745